MPATPADLERTSLRPDERAAVLHAAYDLEHELGDELVGFWLFGSRARGEPPHAESDVDLLVVTQAGRREFKRVADIVYAAIDAEGAAFPVFVTHVLSTAEVAHDREVKHFFMQEVDRDKVVLAGRP